MRFNPMVAILIITLFTACGGVSTTTPTSIPTFLPGAPTFKPSTAFPSFYPSDSPSTTGIISTIAGTGTSSFSGDNGPATSAAMNYPFGAAVDFSGSHYLCLFANLFHSFSFYRQRVRR